MTGIEISEWRALPVLIRNKIILDSGIQLCDCEKPKAYLYETTTRFIGTSYVSEPSITKAYFDGRCAACDRYSNVEKALLKLGIISNAFRNKNNNDSGTIGHFKDGFDTKRSAIFA